MNATIGHSHAVVVPAGIPLRRPQAEPAPAVPDNRDLLRELTRVIENAFQRFDEPTPPQIQALLDRAYDAAGLVKVFNSEAPGGYVAMTLAEAQEALADLLGKREVGLEEITLPEAKP